MKKIVAGLLVCTLAVFVVVAASCSSEKSNNYDNVDKPVIGIAWVPDRNEAFYQNWEYIIQKAGGIPVNLNQVIANDIEYDIYNSVANSELAEEGMLGAKAVDKLINGEYRHSNVGEVMKGIDGVFVPGGEDISPTLIKDFDVKKNTCTGFSASRDVSDCILESYCVDNDIPMFCVCRGMQMLSVICGAHMIQDIPDYCAENNLALNLEHKDTKEWGPKDFVRHNVTVQDKESQFYEIVKADHLDNIPSWHHQAVHDVSNTILRETAVDNSGSFKVIEAVEATGKTFIMGTQFHPEVVVNRVYKMQESDPCDVDTCLRFFQTLINKAWEKSKRNR